MPEFYATKEPDFDAGFQFIELVKQGNADALDELLSSDTRLREHIDSCWFAFGAPAVVCAKRDRAVIDLLLKHGADINARSDWAAGSFGVFEGVDAEQFEFLVSRGGRATIHNYAEQGDVQAVSKLIAGDTTLVRSRGGDGQLPLHFASTIEVCDLLIDAGADLEVRDIDHEATAAQYQVSNPEICRHLIARGAVVDIYMATALGDQDLVGKILQREPEAISSRVGHCPHTKISGHIYLWKLNGANTPLEVARSFGHEQLYQYLFTRSSPKDQLMAALWDANRDAVTALLENNDGLLMELSDGDKKQLARAAWEDKLEAVRLMLDVGFDPHVRGDDESTPLDRAAFHGHREIVQLLLERDNDPPLTWVNSYGGTPLGACVWGSVHGWKKDTDYIGTATLLIDAGSEIKEVWLPVDKNPEMDRLLRKRLSET
ncbi:MAG: ankyrin repeat domain-containing protein [Planctomycetota bacterium]